MSYYLKIQYCSLMLVGDYYIPNITIPKARITGNIGKYGRLKLNYMKKYKIPEYTEMLLGNELKRYLSMRYQISQIYMTNLICKKLTFLKILMKKFKINAIMKAQILIWQQWLPN